MPSDMFSRTERRCSSLSRIFSSASWRVSGADWSEGTGFFSSFRQPGPLEFLFFFDFKRTPILSDAGSRWWSLLSAKSYLHNQTGQTALITVPFPLADSMEKEPPENSTRSLMLESPRPFLEISLEDRLFGSNPFPLSRIPSSMVPSIFCSPRCTESARCVYRYYSRPPG